MRETANTFTRALAVLGALALFCAPQPARAQYPTHPPIAAQAPNFGDPATYEFAQNYMLLLINQERAKAGAGSLRLDPLAGQAAKLHADDMLARNYFSHWNPEGLKPTRRYNLLGGYHALGENIFYNHGELSSVEQSCEFTMSVLMNSPGHRRTIIDQSYTHVGLGFSVNADKDEYYCDQEFIARIGGEYKCPLTAKVGQRVEFSGRFDPARYEFANVIVGFEERPRPRDRLWLMKTSEYSDGEKFVCGYTADTHIVFDGMLTSHDAQADQQAGRFKCQALLDFKGYEGMYYAFLWLTDKRTKQMVLAATATVDVTK